MDIKTRAEIVRQCRVELKQLRLTGQRRTTNFQDRGAGFLTQTGVSPDTPRARADVQRTAYRWRRAVPRHVSAARQSFRDQTGGVNRHRAAIRGRMGLTTAIESRLDRAGVSRAPR